MNGMFVMSYDLVNQLQKELAKDGVENVFIGVHKKSHAMSIRVVMSNHTSHDFDISYELIKQASFDLKRWVIDCIHNRVSNYES